jgi:hypothetical protein
VREIDDLPATVWWGCRFVDPVCTLAQCNARVQESCAALYSISRSQIQLAFALMAPASGRTADSAASDGRENYLVTGEHMFCF